MVTYGAKMPGYGEFVYVALIFGLFVLPRFLERYRLPSGITAFLLGVVASLAFGWFTNDSTLSLLSVLGISALFLFAGLEVDLPEIRANLKVLLQHLAARGLLFVLTLMGTIHLLDLPVRTASLYSIALITPSTGFILDSLKSLGMRGEQRFWVKTKAIATEMIALLAMFLVLRSDSTAGLTFSIAGLLLVIVTVPMLFKLFARIIAPHAQHSEFAFFLMMAILAGVVTKKLGAYYLVGAFIVGITVTRFRSLLPQMDADGVLLALRLFTSFFIPFYFFNAGAQLSSEMFSWQSVGLGILLFVIMTPARVLTVTLQRKALLGETFKESFPVAIALVPTLVFGLVLAEILRAEFDLSPTLLGALITHTVLVTVIPGLMLGNTKFQDVPEPYEVLAERERV